MARPDLYILGLFFTFLCYVFSTNGQARLSRPINLPFTPAPEELELAGVGTLRYIFGFPSSLLVFSSSVFSSATSPPSRRLLSPSPFIVLAVSSSFCLLGSASSVLLLNRGQDPDLFSP